MKSSQPSKANRVLSFLLKTPNYRYFCVSVYGYVHTVLASMGSEGWSPRSWGYRLPECQLACEPAFLPL